MIAMMIAKMLLLVSVSSFRTVIETNQTGRVDNENNVQYAVNSAGHLQPPTHSSEVSLHHSLIQESKPKGSVLSEFGANNKIREALQSLAPAFVVNAVRAVLGGYNPKSNEIPQEFHAAIRVIQTLGQVRGGESNTLLVDPPYSGALFNKFAWTVLNKLSMVMEDFMYETAVFLALRTKFIDEEVQKDFKQIVYLGMGLDTRALRFKKNGVDVFEVDKGEALFMKVQAVTNGDENAYPATFVPAADVAEYLDALPGSVKNDKVLFVWESGAMYTAPEVTQRLLSNIFIRFPSATVVFDSAEETIAGTQYLSTIEKALGKRDMYPGKFAMKDMFATISKTLQGATLQLESVPSTQYAETKVPDYGTYFPESTQSQNYVEHFQNLFQHIRFNIMTRQR